MKEQKYQRTNTSWTWISFIPPPTDDVVDISSEVGEVGKLELSNLTLSEFKSGISKFKWPAAPAGFEPLHTPALLLLRSGSKNTVVFVTNDVFLSTEFVAVWFGLLPWSSFDTDLFGEKVSEDLLLLLLNGVDTPEEPGKWKT